MTNEPTHSPLGASSAKRWMECPGSVSLFKAFGEDEDESTYAAEGTLAHKMAELCIKYGWNARDLAGRTDVGPEEASFPAEFDFDAVQVYVDFCRSKITQDTEVFIEYRIGGLELTRPHPSFYGTLDFCAHDPRTKIVIADLKFGAGIPVEVEKNPQQMYYAFGFVLEHPDIPDDMPVELNIVQPRIPWDRPIKTWTVTAGELRKWGTEVLLPGMDAALVEPDLKAGEWCRFCPRKLQCPLLQGMFKVAATIGTERIPTLQSPALGQEWLLIDAVKMYLRAVEAEAFKRLNLGQDIEGVKLVDKRSVRVWKEGATEVMLMLLGEEAYNPPELKSPPELEKLGGAAKDVVKEWAYYPKTGYTVAAATDRKPGVKVETPAETFANIIAGMEQDNG